VEQDRIFNDMINKALIVYREGTFGEMMLMRIREYSLAANGFLFFHVNILAMFLIGQYAARKGYLKNIPEHLPFFRKLCMWGFIIGIPTALFAAYASVFHDIYSANPEIRNHGEFLHRYVLGLYDLLARLTAAFPHVLFEYSIMRKLSQAHGRLNQSRVPTNA
ncbi:MAG: hypothetical protein EOM17_13615, partial [Synergistales bacterium]|nr:hypothetical protein [Synergistales bacterium]